MCCTPEMVKFTDDGQWVYVKGSECPPVKYWQKKYGAKVTVARMPEGGGFPIIDDPGWEPLGSRTLDEGSEKGFTVWVVPHSTERAYYEGTLIERLVSPANAKDYKDVRRKLSEAGYTDKVLCGTNPR